MTTVFMTMATILSELDEQKPGTNIQKEEEGHTITPPSGQNGVEDPEVLGAPHPNHHPSLQ